MKVTIDAKNIGKVFNADVINYNENISEWERYVEKRKFLKTDEIKIFLSYSHDDDDIKERLDKHLASLKRIYNATIWSDRKIIPGTEWDSEIKRELDEADIILLLISAGFIASDYIWRVELSKAIEKHDKSKTMVIPIFCKACDFKKMPFAKIQGLPANAEPINSSPDIDVALTKVVSGIGLVFENLVKNIA